MGRILKSLVPNPYSTNFHMVQHVADWVAPFPRSQHSSPPPLELLHIRPSPPPSPLCARELGAIIIIIEMMQRI